MSNSDLEDEIIDLHKRLSDMEGRININRFLSSFTFGFILVLILIEVFG